MLATVDQSAMSMAVFLDRRAKSPDCAGAGSYLGNFARREKTGFPFIFRRVSPRIKKCNRSASALKQAHHRVSHPDGLW